MGESSSQTTTGLRTSATDTAEVATRLRLAITRMARRLRQEAGAGLTPSQVAALATIERHGPLAPSELAEREQIKRPSVTRILSRLAERELVERIPDPDDGRSAIVTVTPSGRELVRRLRRRKTAYLASRMRGLSRADLEALAGAASVLERILEQDSTAEQPLPDAAEARSRGRSA